jgi:lipopolysaccharide transport system ATP-binding protein
MNSDICIRVENLGKLYRIGEREPYKTLRDALARPFQRAFSRRSRHSGSREYDQYIWALKGVSFNISEGEVVGIIGMNGAGKSTLLKILSRITEPTEGNAEIHGRVGSLLEVGTGFHSELTGRENAYLSGALLGMKKREIDRKFDEIVSFAELSKFIDTPIKYYSSGMQVRLGFAVAASLETEVLLVDEVLAVGDVAFQKKCMSKMWDVAKEGRTVLFVSHNMGAVSRLCERCVLLDHGRVSSIGETAGVISTYLNAAYPISARREFASDPSKPMQIRSVTLLDHQGEASTHLNLVHPIRVTIEVDVRQRISGTHLALSLEKPDGTAICHSTDLDSEPDKVVTWELGSYVATAEFPGALLNAGTYTIRVGIGLSRGATVQTIDSQTGMSFQLYDPGTFGAMNVDGYQREGLLLLQVPWKIQRTDSCFSKE